MLNPAALYFNNNTVAQYGKLSTASSIRNLSGFTFVARFKVGERSTNATYQHAYVERQGTGSLIRFRFTPVEGRLQFGFSPRDGRIDTSYTYRVNWDDRWHTAAFVARMGTDPTYEIILDGVTVSDGTLVVPAEVETISDTAPKGIFIGNHNRQSTGESYSLTSGWHGWLNDIMIFNTALTQQDIVDYIGSNDAWESGDESLIVHYMLNEGSGTTVKDIAVTPNRTGTLYGSPTWTWDRPYIGNGLLDTTPPPTPITNAATNIRADGFTASWGAVTDNVAVQFYELHVSTTANFASYINYDTRRNTSQSVRGLLPATTYYWRVRALDAARNSSGYSATRSLTTLPIGDITPPEPPTNLTASSITHSDFLLSYTPSPSTDVVGYRVDVATDSDFSNFLANYRGTDSGLTNPIAIVGVEPLTSYYVRMRAYDGSYKESNDSTVLRVNTPRQPDITPPLEVTIKPATGVSSTSATLNWEQGVDDIGVVEYHVDIATTEDFGVYALTQTMLWQDVDVGNILSYRVEGLTPSTRYYYRVRAYDEAGNASPNPLEGEVFTTDVPSIYEGGFLDATEFVATWKVGSNVDPDIIHVSATESSRLLFNLVHNVGTLSSAVLSITPKPSSRGPTTLGNIRVKATSGDIDDPMGTEYLTYNITQLNEPIEIDITSLLTENAASYVIEIASDGFVGYFDSGEEVEGFNENDMETPHLRTLFDPMTSTQPLPFSVEIDDAERKNLCRNPSFEIDNSFWVADAGVTMSRNSSPAPSKGTVHMYYTTTTPSTGVGGSTSTANMVSVSSGEKVFFAVDLMSYGAPSGLYAGLVRQYLLMIEGFNSNGNSLGALDSVSVYNFGYWSRYSLGTTISGEVAYIRPKILTLSSGTVTTGVDNVTIEKSSVDIAQFDGTTSNAKWDGTANDSTSTILAPQLTVYSPYIGDSNENNSVRVFFRHILEENGWISATATQLPANRTLKQHGAIIGPTIPNYNKIKNPSFETGTRYWAGGERTNNTSASGNYSYRSTGNSVLHLPVIPVRPNALMSLQAMIMADAEVSVSATIYVVYASGTYTTFTTSPIVYGNGYQFLPLTHTFTTPLNSVGLLIQFNATGGTERFNIDKVQLNDGYWQPYRDGDTLDGMWEGNAHESSTALQLLNDQEYVIKFEYTDPEGFFDTHDGTVLEHVETYKTPIPPDNPTTVSTFDFRVEPNTIYVTLPYEGDDNDNMTVRLEFKRADLSSWNELRPLYNRYAKKITATLSNLKHGTAYTVRAIIDDPDGVFGVVNRTLTQTVTSGYLAGTLDADPHVSFGGFVLMGRYDRKIGVTRHNAFGFPDRRMQVEDLPRIDGAVEMQALWGKKTIDIEGFISGDSRSELNELRGALVRALSPRRQRLIIDTLSHKGRFYYATCERLDIPEEAEENLIHLRWHATFTCADPFAYDIAEVSLPTFNVSNEASAIALTNEGDIHTGPYFNITTASGYPINVTLANTTTGELIAPKVTIINGDRLVFDSERRSLTKNGIEVDYAGTFPHLTMGGNLFEISLSAPTAPATFVPTVSVDVRWRHRYL